MDEKLFTLQWLYDFEWCGERSVQNNTHKDYREEHQLDSFFLVVLNVPRCSLIEI